MSQTTNETNSINPAEQTEQVAAPVNGPENPTTDAQEEQASSESEGTTDKDAKRFERTMIRLAVEWDKGERCSSKSRLKCAELAFDELSKLVESGKTRKAAVDMIRLELLKHSAYSWTESGVSRLIGMHAANVLLFDGKGDALPAYYFDPLQTLVERDGEDKAENWNQVPHIAEELSQLAADLMGDKRPKVDEVRERCIKLRAQSMEREAEAVREEAASKAKSASKETDAKEAKRLKAESDVAAQEAQALESAAASLLASLSPKDSGNGTGSKRKGRGGVRRKPSAAAEPDAVKEREVFERTLSAIATNAPDDLRARTACNALGTSAKALRALLAMVPAQKEWAGAILGAILERKEFRKFFGRSTSVRKLVESQQSETVPPTIAGRIDTNGTADS